MNTPSMASPADDLAAAAAFETPAEESAPRGHISPTFQDGDLRWLGFAICTGAIMAQSVFLWLLFGWLTS